MIKLARIPPEPGQKSWGVFVTGPHIGWHMIDLVKTKKDAIELVKTYRTDGFHDAAAVARITFGDVTEWHGR